MIIGKGWGCINIVTKHVYNVLGGSLAITGVIMLLLASAPSQYVLWLVVGLIGVVLVGGLPSKKDLLKLAKLSPVTLLVGLLLTTFLIKSYGADFTLRFIITGVLALFVVQNVVLKSAMVLLKN